MIFSIKMSILLTLSLIAARTWHTRLLESFRPILTWSSVTTVMETLLHVCLRTRWVLLTYDSWQLFYWKIFITASCSLLMLPCCLICSVPLPTLLRKLSTPTLTSTGRSLRTTTTSRASSPLTWSLWTTLTSSSPVPSKRLLESE